MTDVAPRSAFAIDPTSVAPPSMSPAALAPQPLVTTPAVRGFQKSDIVLIGGSIACVSGVAALAHWLPSEITLAGSAILAAAAAGIAAARIFTSRTPQGTSMAALVGMAGIAAITAMGSVGMVNQSKNEMLTARAALVEQVQVNAGERAALVSERGAITAERQALQAERGQVSAGRQQLQAARETFNGEMVAARTALAAEKAELDNAVRQAAERLVAPERAALAASRAELDAQRSPLEVRLSALSAEARLLTPRQIAAIGELADVYINKGEGRLYRFVGDTWSGGRETLPNERMVASSNVLASLVSRGHIIVGGIKAAPDDKWVVPVGAETRITTVAQLVEFLRLGTGRVLPPN